MTVSKRNIATIGVVHLACEPPCIGALHLKKSRGEPEEEPPTNKDLLQAGNATFVRQNPADTFERVYHEFMRMPIEADGFKESCMVARLETIATDVKKQQGLPPRSSSVLNERLYYARLARLSRKWESGIRSAQISKEIKAIELECLENSEHADLRHLHRCTKLAKQLLERENGTKSREDISKEIEALLLEIEHCDFDNPLSKISSAEVLELIATMKRVLQASASSSHQQSRSAALLSKIWNKLSSVNKSVPSTTELNNNQI